MSGRMDWLHTGVALQGGLARDAFAALGGHELAPGERLGPFAVGAEIGRGGMAIVYAAARADGEFEQQVAIKWMPGGAHGETAALLFLRERQILAELRHPHIARLLDGGRTADGMLWFAMERVEGLRLDHHIADGRAATLRERLRLFHQACAALAFAHGRGLVHRDIKPANIAVDADGSVKLLDFGVALLAEQDPASLIHAYTPGWASPEQLRGEPTGPASDIYQLGLLLRWLLAAAPLDGVRITRERRRELDTILAHALAERPEQRYASVAEFERDLDAWQLQRPLVAHRGGRGYRLGLFLRRHAFASAFAAFALASVVALSAGFTWRLAAERDRAVAQAERADAAREFLVSLFRGADPTARKGQDLSARDLLDRGEARIGNELATQPALRADLQESLASVYNYLAEHERAEKLVRAALESAPANDPHQRIDRARRMLLLADIHARAVRPADALAHTDEALALLAGEDSATALELELGALNLRAMAFKHLERADDAADALQRLLARVDASPKAQDHRAYAADNLAHVHEGQGRWNDALVQAGVAERAFLALRGPDHPEPWAVAAYRASLHYATRDLAAARSRYEQVLAAQQRLYEPQDRRIMNTRTSLARVALRQGDAEAASGLLQAALAECERQFGPDHVECPLTWQLQGELQLQRGDIEGAIQTLREAVALREGPANTGHRSLALAQIPLATALCAHADIAQGRRVIAMAAINLRTTSPAPLDGDLLAAGEAQCDG